MYNTPNFYAHLCTVNKVKKRPFHTIFAHFSTNLTPAPQKIQKSLNLQIADD